MTSTTPQIIAAKQSGPLRAPIVVEAPIGYFLKIFSEEIQSCGQSAELENNVGMLTLIQRNPAVLHLALQTNLEVSGFMLCHKDGGEQAVTPSRAPAGLPDDYARLGEWWQVPAAVVKLESFIRLILTH